MSPSSTQPMQKENTRTPFGFSNWDYLEPLRDHQSFVVIFVLSAVLCSLALTYIYSEKYEAIVAIVLSAGNSTRLQFRGESTEALGAPLPPADFKVIGKTLEDLAVNERLLQELVSQFNLDEPETRTYEGPWYVRYYDMAKDIGKDFSRDIWAYLKYGRIPGEDLTATAVTQLAADVKITNEDSYVFYLSVRDKDPDRVARLADAMAKKLVALSDEANITSASDQRRELESLRAIKLGEIALSQRRMDNLLKENQLVSVGQELLEGVDELYALQAEHRRLQAELREEEHVIAALESRLASVDELIRPKDRSSANGSGVERLQSEDIKRMVSDKLFAEVELEGLAARSFAIERSIAALDSSLKKLPSLKIEIDQLENDLARANREFGQINVAINELVVQESEDLAEFQVQHKATPPTAPITPIKIYHVGLAGTLGLAFSIGLVYVFSYFNVRIFTASGGVKKRRQRQLAAKKRHGPSPERTEASAPRDNRAEAQGDTSTRRSSEQKIDETGLES